MQVILKLLWNWMKWVKAIDICMAFVSLFAFRLYYFIALLTWFLLLWSITLYQYRIWYKDVFNSLVSKMNFTVRLSDRLRVSMTQMEIVCSRCIDILLMMQYWSIRSWYIYSNYNNIFPSGLGVAFIHHPCLLTKTAISFISGETYSTSHCHIYVRQSRKLL